MTSLAEVATGDHEGSGFVMGFNKVGSRGRAKDPCLLLEPRPFDKDCTLFETAQESLNLRGGVGSEGKLPPPHKEELLVAAKPTLERPQYLRHCESFLHSEVMRGKRRRRRQNPFQKPVTLSAQALCQGLGLGSRELSLICTPGGAGSRSFLK